MVGAGGGMASDLFLGMAFRDVDRVFSASVFAACRPKYARSTESRDRLDRDECWRNSRGAKPADGTGGIPDDALPLGTSWPPGLRRGISRLALILRTMGPHRIRSSRCLSRCR